MNKDFDRRTRIKSPAVRPVRGAAAWFARLSTSTRLLLVLLLTLLPLALIAVVALHQINLNSAAQANRLVTESVSNGAQQLANVMRIERRFAYLLIKRQQQDDDAGEICAALQRRYRTMGPGAPAFALTWPERPQFACSYGTIPQAVRRAMEDKRSAAEFQIIPDNGLIIRDSELRNDPRFIAYFDRASLDAILGELGQSGGQSLDLSDGQRLFAIQNSARTSRFRDHVSQPLGLGKLELVMRTNLTRISSPQLISLVVPFSMMLAAAIVGWLVVDRMVIAPLAALKRKLELYEPGSEITPSATRWLDASELTDLDSAFIRLGQQVAADKASLRDGLERQKALTREVHHRVKNNLQIVTSLINLHARKAAGDGADQAFLTIQRRVDALSVVYRNHRAVHEVQTGISLRSLICELVGSFREADGNSDLSRFTKLDIDELCVNQDVAMATTFLLTEIFDSLASGGAADDLLISVHADPTSDAANPTAQMRMTSRRFCAGGLFDQPGGSETTGVFAGLSRQLRQPLELDRTTGVLSIRLPVVQDNGDDEASPL